MNWINEHSTFIGIMCSVLAAVSGYVLFALGFLRFKRENKMAIKQKSFTTVYKPLFDMIEPTLYKDLSQEQYLTLLEAINKIVQEDRIIEGYELSINLFYAFKHIERDLSTGYYQLRYKTICKKIDNTYDKLSRKLGYPVRKFFYREANKQFFNRRMKLGYFMKTLLAMLLTILPAITLITFSFMITLVFLLKFLFS